MSAIKKLLTKSFVERLISGIILVAIAIVTIMLGGDVLLITTGIISVIGYFELIRVYKLEKSVPGIIGYIATVGYYILLKLLDGNIIKKDLRGHMGMESKNFIGEYLIFFAIIFIICLMASYVLTFPKYKADDIMVCFFGFFYVVVMLSYIYQVREIKEGTYLVWLIFLSSWGCDTCAYLVGVMFGKHKMAPVLSPKKSIEGGIGGVLGAALLGFIYASIFKDSLRPNAQTMYAIVCGVGGLVSQIGDLMASGIKRDHEIKDYSRLIPGHGGILDRFDSMIVTAPIIFYLSIFLSK